MMIGLWILLLHAVIVIHCHLLCGTVLYSQHSRKGIEREPQWVYSEYVQKSQTNTGFLDQYQY